MSKIIKPLSTQITLSASVGNTVSNAVMVRLVNANSTNRDVTRSDSSNSAIGSFTILVNSEAYIRKDISDQLHVSAGSDVKATSIAILD